MGDLPLHPVLVHLPLGGAVLWPWLAAGLALAIRRQALPARSWWIAAALGVVVALGGWAAMETGEGDAEKAVRVVPEEAIHEHHEAGERFVILAGVTALVGLGGLLRREEHARRLRVASAVLALVVLAAAAQTGHLGGRLVYVHDAAAAHGAKARPPTPAPAGAAEGEEHASGSDLE